jgi:predicted transcriptional regulator
MVQKTRTITIRSEGGAFYSIFKRFKGETKDFDFEGLSALRRILSNEKARLLHIVKIKKPDSIYTLARMLGRDFKSVREDIKLLERFGFINLISEKKGKRTRLKPEIAVDTLNITLYI